MVLAQQDSAGSTFTDVLAPGGQMGVVSPCVRKKHLASKWPTSLRASRTSNRLAATRRMGVSNQSRPSGVSWKWTPRMISARVTSAWPMLVRIQAAPCMSAGTVNVKVRTSPQKQTLLWPGAGSWRRAVECCIQGLRAECQRLNTLEK